MLDRYEVFIEEYLRTFNKTEAARAAGYKDKNMSKRGQEVYNHPDVQAEIKRRLSENHMSAEEVLQRLADEARGDIGDYLEENPDTHEITISLLNRKGERKNTRLIKKVTQVRTKRKFKDGSEEEELRLSLELYDAQAAKVQLGRAHALFTDKVEQPGAPLPIVVLKQADLDALMP